MHLDYTKVIILILWWRNFQLEYWRTFQLVSTVMAEAKCAGDRARTAEEVASSMGKADVIGRFGPGVLEELEDADGNIDTSRLAELIELFGGAKQDIDTEPEPERGRYA